MELTIKPSTVYRLDDGDLLVLHLPKSAPYSQVKDIQERLEWLRTDLKMNHGIQVYFLMAEEGIKITHYRAITEEE